jgi:hypothetical protein
MITPFTEEIQAMMRPWVFQLVTSLYVFAVHSNDEAAISSLAELGQTRVIWEQSTADQFYGLKEKLTTSPYLEQYMDRIRDVLHQRQIELEGF